MNNEEMYDYHLADFNGEPSGLLLVDAYICNCHRNNFIVYTKLSQ